MSLRTSAPLRAAAALAVATALGPLAGCGDGGQQGPSAMEQMAAQAEEQQAKQQSDMVAMAAQQEAQAKQNAIEAAAADKAAKAAQAKALAERYANEAPSPVTPDDMVRGRQLKGGGALSVTLRAGIVAEQKLKLATIQEATNLYYGLEGHFPKTHEEFMEKVIKFNQIELEPLQEPYEYWYNPEENALYKRVKPEVIEQAKANAAAAGSPIDEPPADATIAPGDAMMAPGDAMMAPGDATMAPAATGTP